MIQALTSKEKVDRMAVIVSGGVTKLLGVPLLPSATTEAQASVIHHSSGSPELKSDGKDCLFCRFILQPANTVLKIGACVLLRQTLNRVLISLACRHYIREVI